MIALNLRSAIFAFFVLFIGVSAIALDPAVQSDTLNGTITSSTSAVAAETSSPSSSYEIEAARGGGGRVGGGYRGGIVGGGGARNGAGMVRPNVGLAIGISGLLLFGLSGGV